MDHASSQQNRVAYQLSSLSHELGSMASKSDEEGLAKDLAQQASQQLDSIAHWLQVREPGDLITEVKDFARRKPGTFLAVAAGIGLLAGRMTRGVKAGAPDQDVPHHGRGRDRAGAPGRHHPGVVGDVARHRLR